MVDIISYKDFHNFLPDFKSSYINTDTLFFGAFDKAKIIIDTKTKAYMPVFVKKRFGCKHLYQPAFSQFTTIDNLSQTDTPEKFYGFILRYFDTFNFNTDFVIENESFIQKISYILNLKPSYDKIYQNFHKTHKKNIRKAYNRNNFFMISNDFYATFNLIVSLLKSKNIGLKKNDFSNLLNIFRSFSQKDRLEVFEVRDDTNSLIAGAVFITNGYFYQIYSAANEIGRKNLSMYMIINEFLKKHSSTEAILDFAGSQIKGIADFNKGFGASPKIYYNARKCNGWCKNFFRC